MALRTRNAAVLAKIESTAGTDASPVAGSDAVLVENPSINFSPNVIRTNEVTGTLSARGPIVGGMTVAVSFDVYLKGSGTAGTAPEWGKLLRACGFAETVTGTAVPSSSEALGTGASTTAATLGSSASTTAQIYRGMPINFTSAVVGTAFITDYTTGKVATLTDTLGGTLTSTSNYQIPVNVRYSPASTSLPSLTIYLFMDGLRYRVVGCVGTVRFSLASGQAGRMSFSFTGVFFDKTDTSVPTGLVYDSTRPPIWRNGAALINRHRSGISSIAYDVGNTITLPDNPNTTEGYDPAEIRARQDSGTIQTQEYLVATRDIMTDFRAGTARIVHARWGTTAGNRIGVTWPAAQYLNQSPQDSGGQMDVSVPFDGTGDDAEVFITQW